MDLSRGRQEITVTLQGPSFADFSLVDMPKLIFVQFLEELRLGMLVRLIDLHFTALYRMIKV